MPDDSTPTVAAGRVIPRRPGRRRRSRGPGYAVTVDVGVAGAPGIRLYSGRGVSHDDGVPTLTDIAVSLSRLPRFCGHGRRWWSVLDHSLYCAVLAGALADERGLTEPQAYAPLVAAALLHDAHECLTGDVPTPFKDEAMREMQARQDVRLFDEYMPGGYAAFKRLRADVHEIDRRAMLAEAILVGPAGYASLDATFAAFGDTPSPLDVGRLRVILDEQRLGVPPLATNQHEHPAVRSFVRLIQEMRYA